MNDCISRQAAIDALDKRFDSVPMEQTTEILMLRKDLRELPSSQPRKGKWAGKGDSEGFGIFICDNCGKFAMMEYDFCPNCGSYNGGKNEA